MKYRLYRGREFQRDCSKLCLPRRRYFWFAHVSPTGERKVKTNAIRSPLLFFRCRLCDMKQKWKYLFDKCWTVGSRHSKIIIRSVQPQFLQIEIYYSGFVVRYMHLLTLLAFSRYDIIFKPPIVVYRLGLLLGLRVVGIPTFLCQNVKREMPLNICNPNFSNH